MVTVCVKSVVCENVMMIVGRGTGITATAVDTTFEVPVASRIVAEIL
jgi:hypothetical protein